jgi:tRNA threonylcarbamoyladenosine biosynthesis protein TsaE
VSEIRTSRSDEETQAIARQMAADLQPGDVLLLSGDLGAGKTTFTKGLAQGLGVPADEVTSPTFALIHEYRGGRLALFHVDLYRLERVSEGDLGLEELRGQGGVLVIEWPDRLRYEPSPATAIRLEWVDDTTRRIHVERTTAVPH